MGYSVNPATGACFGSKSDWQSNPFVEDHPLVRIGLRNILSQKDNLEVVGEVSTASEALVAALEHQPDIVLMDIRLPDGSGIDACQNIVDQCPTTRIIFLTSYSGDLMIQGLGAGAHGYLLKEVKPARLIQAIEMVAEGHSILNHQIIRRVQAYLKTQEARPASLAKQIDLSGQQERVLSLVAKGKTNKEIAVELGLSEKTVRNYLTTIFQKLHITHRTEAAVYFTQKFPLDPGR